MSTPREGCWQRPASVYCEDMMPEVALVKLGFLLGNYDRKKAAEAPQQEHRRRDNERTEVDW